MDLLAGEELPAGFELEQIKSCLEFRDCPLEFSGTELRVALFDHRSSGGDNGVFLATEEYARFIPPSSSSGWRFALRHVAKRIIETPGFEKLFGDSMVRVWN